MNYQITIDHLQITNAKLAIGVRGWADCQSQVAHPKLILHFFNAETGEDRRLPLVIKHTEVQEGRCFFSGDFTYLLEYLYYPKAKPHNHSSLYLNVLFEDYYEEKAFFTTELGEMEETESYYSIEYAEDQQKKPYFRIEKTREQLPLENAEVGVVGRIWSWIMFLAAVALTPLFLFDAILAELRLLPYKSAHTLQGRSCPSRLFRHVNAHFRGFSRIAIDFKGIRLAILKFFFAIHKLKKQDPKGIALMSVRRDTLSGNMEYVYEYLKDREEANIRMFFSNKEFADLNLKEMWQIARLCAVSKVIAVDEYTYFLYQLKLRENTRIIQLWHACGAFKTFGYTRLGKAGGTPQTAPTHRNYDYVTVSSDSVRIWYAEGFGVPTDHIVDTGIARTDVFFKEDYKKETLQRLYAQYPMLQGKKVVLFAPTFRGDKRENGYYPMEKFDVDRFLSALPEDYVMIIKHHPFVQKKHPVGEACRDRVLDLSESSELNELLFLTDLVITDYSSLVFEASLLNIPMLFYTFDLKEYIRSRDFYFNFETFIPGNLFYTQEEMAEAILAGDLGSDKIPAFKEKFCGRLDGHASERIADLMCEMLK